jgi:hypothetical protein
MLKDGKDITNEIKKQAAEKGNPPAGKRDSGAEGGQGGGMGGIGIVPDEGFPLDSTAREKISLLPGSSFIAESGRRYALIPFEEKGQIGRIMGSLKVEAETGRPVELRLDIPLPAPASGKFDYSFFFSVLPNGGFAPIIQEFSGNAGFLLWKSNFDGKVELSGYRCGTVRPPHAGGGGFRLGIYCVVMLLG